MADRPQQVGSYRVDQELGRGGMGVVYMGHDTRLERPVAIKALPGEFAQDPDRLARFEREAKVLASLSHPNVAGIYGIEELEETKYLILEFVEGEDLAERLLRGPLPMDEALEVCKQIAAGVEAAHEAGVIHRDLKPGNIKITPDGLVKVLDFGLAKPAGVDPVSGPDMTQSPTLTYGVAREGVVLGTAGYMSPEQARGRRVDRRTDIWSMGCILYEMLTAKQAFQGETISDTLAAVLRGEPDWEILPPSTHPAVRRLLRRCLEKDPRKRMRDAADAVLDLDEALHAHAGGIEAHPLEIKSHRGRNAWISGIAAAVCLLVGAALGLWLGRGPSEKGVAPKRPTMVSIELPGTIQFRSARISPDGRTLALLGTEKAVGKGSEGSKGGSSRIFIRPMDSFEFEPLRGTEGARALLFSADSRWLAFIAPLAPDNSKARLMKVPVDGSAPPVAVADWQESWNDVGWLSDGDFLICKIPGEGFLRLPSSGNAPAKEIKIADPIPGTVFYQSPRNLPLVGQVLLGRVSYGARGFAMDTVLLDLATGKVKTLVEDGGSAAYSADGHLFFTRGDTLLAAPFDLSREAVTGGAIAVMDGLKTENTWAPAGFELSSDGTLGFAPGGRAGGQRGIALAGDDGKPVEWSADRKAFNGQVAASRDGHRLAVGITRPEGLDEIWVSDSGGRTIRRFATSADADLDYPVWSPDGSRVVYAKISRSDKDGIYWQRSDGAGQSRPLVTANTNRTVYMPTAWTPDGKAVLAQQTLVGEGIARIVRVEVPEDGSPSPEPKILLEVGKACGLPRLSPDGRLLAFTSNLSGQNQVYVCTFGPGDKVGPPVPVSESQGYSALWAQDGKSLAFLSDGGRIQSVNLFVKGNLAPEHPVPLPDGGPMGLVSGPLSVDRLPDGRFVFIQKGEGEGDVTSLRLVLNSTQELKARVPSSGR